MSCILRQIPYNFSSIKYYSLNFFCITLKQIYTKVTSQNRISIGTKIRVWCKELPGSITNTNSPSSFNVLVCQKRKGMPTFYFKHKRDELCHVVHKEQLPNTIDDVVGGKRRGDSIVWESQIIYLILPDAVRCLEFPTPVNSFCYLSLGVCKDILGLLID